MIEISILSPPPSPYHGTSTILNKILTYSVIIFLPLLALPSKHKQNKKIEQVHRSTSKRSRSILFYSKFMENYLALGRVIRHQHLYQRFQKNVSSWQTQAFFVQFSKVPPEVPGHIICYLPLRYL